METILRERRKEYLEGSHSTDSLERHINLTTYFDGASRIKTAVQKNWQCIKMKLPDYQVKSGTPISIQKHQTATGEGKVKL